MEEINKAYELEEGEIKILEETISRVSLVHHEELSSNNLEAILEGILFAVGEEGVSLETLSKLLDLSKDHLSIALKEYANKLKESKRGIELLRYDDHFKLLTKANLFPILAKLFKIKASSSLSKSSLETLAIIAYKQPISRIEIEELRGVNSESIIRKLISRNLIKEAGRANTPGKPFLYEVTKEFLDSFKLLNLDELPSLPDFAKDDNKTKSLFES